MIGSFAWLQGAVFTKKWGVYSTKLIDSSKKSNYFLLLLTGLIAILLISGISLGIAFQNQTQVRDKIKYVPGERGVAGESGRIGNRGIKGDKAAPTQNIIAMKNRFQNTLDRLKSQQAIISRVKMILPEELQTKLDQLESVVNSYDKKVIELMREFPIKET